MEKKDNTLSGKTVMTGATGVVGGAGLAPLIVWLFGLGEVEVPAEVAGIIGGLVTAIVTFLVAWLKPAKSGTYVNTDYVPKH